MPLTYYNPVLEVDFPDPGIFWDDETQKYYGYSTNANGKNVQCCFSTDFCTWHLSENDALPGPYPAWTGKDGFRCWAPEVCKAPEGRPGFLMYFSTHDWNTDVMSIATAYSPESPLGPFGFVGNGPIVSQGYHGGTIDPQPFIDPVNNKSYLIFKNDGNHRQTAQTRIWIQELSPDGLSVLHQPHAILAPTRRWHKNLIEAPYLVYHRASQTYILFFSTGFYGNEDYSTGYAWSKRLYGPYTPERNIFLGTDEKREIRGPGGISVVERGPEDEWMIAFHAHDRKGGGHRRQMCVHRLQWSSQGRPMLAGKFAHYGHRVTFGKEEDGDQTRDFAKKDKDKDKDKDKEAAAASAAIDGPLKPSSLKEKNKKRLSTMMQWIKDY